jgi:probable dihydroxyacetone kinase regulator
MSNTNITKMAIAETMKYLMLKIPFAQITVTDIIDLCGISRKTFYYHFKDKYDLVNWIFSIEIIDPVIEGTTLEHLTDCYLKLCRYIKENKTFCSNAINAIGQNSFVDFLQSYVEKQISILCGQFETNKSLTKDDIKFLNVYYYNAFIGVLKTWIKNGLKDSPEMIVKRWNGLIYKNIEHYICTMRKK